MATAPLEPRVWAERNREVVARGLEWLRRRLEAHIADLRACRPLDPGARAPDVMTDVEADWLLHRLGDVPRDGEDLEAPRASAPPGAERVEAARQAHDDARTALRTAGAPAAIDRLAAVFGLAPFDEDVVLLALAPRVDAGFAALYGYVHDRLGVTHATPHLALALLAPGARAEGLARLGPDGPLRRHALITVDDDGAGALATLRLDERIAGYLMGDDHLDARVRPWLRALAQGTCPERHLVALESLAAAIERTGWPAGLVLGPRRAGRRAMARALAARFGLGLAELEPRLLPADPDARRARLALAGREARLGGFGVLIDATPPPAPGREDVARIARDVAEEALAALDALVIVIAEDRPDWPVVVPAVRLTPLDARDRAALWRQARAGEARAEPGDVGDEVVDAVAEQFALGPEEIATVAATTAGEALWDACREASGRQLEALAERLDPHFDWDDLVLPATVREDLQAIAAQVRHRAQVYRRWGFARRLPRGRGVAALFAGPSGVGKTMAADVIARDLRLDLYRIDLAGVISKYIGETEKNLKKVFDAAEAGGAVLFFDEADALFGKRSEVKDSHDRYANIEVSYLLQRMESYTGLAILATNLKGHLDPAFLRRLRYVVDFPFPDAELRRRLWARAFPPEAPAERLDLDALARLEIAGGSITVIAVNAAFLAAAERRPIGLEHVARAARAEFRKLDREFRPPWPERR